MNWLLPLLLLGGGSALSGLTSNPLMLMMLMGGSKAMSNPLTMMGLVTGNTQLATLGLVSGTSGTTGRPRRRRYNRSATQIAYLRGAVSMLRRG